MIFLIVHILLLSLYFFVQFYFYYLLVLAGVLLETLRIRNLFKSFTGEEPFRTNVYRERDKTCQYQKKYKGHSCNKWACMGCVICISDFGCVGGGYNGLVVTCLCFFVP